VGLWRAPRPLRLIAVASAPAAIAFSYVQQPDRAWWNFAFVLVPLTAPILADAAPALRWSFVAGYVLSNVHLGPLLTRWLELPGFVLAAGVSIVIINAERRRRVENRIDPNVPALASSSDIGFGVRIGFAASAMVLAGLLAVAVDVARHRATEQQSGLNIWGYRGPVLRQKTANEIRIAILGGSIVFGERLGRATTPQYLQDDLNNPRLQQDARFTAPGWISVVNLATPCDRPTAFPQTLRDYGSLRLDAVCFYLGPEDRCGRADGWRRTSAIFRRTGYLPLAPGLGPSTTFAEPLGDGEHVTALGDAVTAALADGLKVLVAVHPFLDSASARRVTMIAEMLHERFDDSRVGYVDLRRAIEPAANLAQADGIHPTDLGTSRIGEHLSQSVFRLLAR